MDIQSLPTAIPDRPRRSRLALLDFLLACFDAQSNSVQVVQVGANDGKLDDPILPHWSKPHWKGVLIEPHPLYFSALASLHAANPNVSLVNAPVSQVAGSMTLYHLDETYSGAYPGWLRGCASLDRGRMVAAIDRANRKTGADVPHSAVAETTVAARRLDDILAETGVSAADILVIDVEGHERPVLDSFDPARLGLSLAIVECNAGDPAEQDAIVSALNAAGLVSYRLAADIVALRPGRVTIPIEAMFHFNNLVPLTVQETVEPNP